MRSKRKLLRKRLQEKFFAGRSAAYSPKILILGLGVQGGGVGAARFFALLGTRVTVTDLKTKKDLGESLRQLEGLPITYVLGKHRVEDIQKSDLIVKNPGIPAESPFIREAQRLKIPITNDAEIFLALAPRDRIIGITGTKGKTTLTKLIGHLLGKKGLVVGIPGVSFFEYFYAKKEPQWIAAEFSSFDLEYTHESPHIAVITSLFADHLNRYTSFAKYARYKMNIARFQTPSDFFIAHGSKRIRLHMPRLKSTVTYVTEKVLLKRGQTFSWRLPVESVAIARRIAPLLGIKEKLFWSRIRTFMVPPGRLEIIARRAGRVFINDTTATNPGSASHSIRQIRNTFGHRIHLSVITGGEDKIFPLDELRTYAHNLTRYANSVFMLPGSMTEKLSQHFTRGVLCDSLEIATIMASARRGIVALIPGAASFNMFVNEFHRAEVFAKTVRSLQL